MGLNGKPLPKRVVTLYEQLIYVKGPDGNVVQTLRLTKDGRLIDVATGGIITTLQKLNTTPGRLYTTISKSDM